jgi:hypothetical protein
LSAQAREFPLSGIDEEVVAFQYMKARGAGAHLSPGPKLGELHIVVGLSLSMQAERFQ